MAGEATTPWWTNLIVFFGTAFLTLGVPRLARLFGRDSTSPGLGTTLRDAIAYLPHAMLLFGVLADALTYEGVYSIPSLIAVLSIPANWIMGFFWQLLRGIYGGVSDLLSPRSPFTEKPTGPRPDAPNNPPTSRTATGPAPQSIANLLNPPKRGGASAGEFAGQYDGCDIQGFDFLRSKYAPQTFVVTATIFSYYLMDMINNRGPLNSTATIVLFSVLYIAQLAVVGDCRKDPSEFGPIVKWLISLVEGMFFGGISYSVVQVYYPERLPSSAMPTFPRKSASELSAGPNGTMVDSDGKTYNCLPNGQCLPDLSSLDSRKKFAESLGTGQAAVPENCSSS